MVGTAGGAFSKASEYAFRRLNSVEQDDQAEKGTIGGHGESSNRWLKATTGEKLRRAEGFPAFLF